MQVLSFEALEKYMNISFPTIYLHRKVFCEVIHFSGQSTTLTTISSAIFEVVLQQEFYCALCDFNLEIGFDFIFCFQRHKIRRYSRSKFTFN